jgi:hypothetical protein
MAETRKMILRNIPDDVFKILLTEQHKEKILKNRGQFGLEQTIYKIVRDYERCRKAEEIEKLHK